MTESEPREHTLKEWENELNKDLLFLENVMDQEDFQNDTPEHINDLSLQLKNFFCEADIQCGHEIIRKIKQIKTDEYTTKVMLNIIQQLIKAVLITEPLKEFGVETIKFLPYFLDKNSTSTKKKELFSDIYKKYSFLMPKFKQTITTAGNSQIIVDKINEMLSGKLDEINIKIEENQRALHQLATIPSLPSEKRSFQTEEDILPEYMEENAIDTPELFYICKIGASEVALSEEQVLNIYKISPKRAIKMAKKSFIRFSQLGNFFLSITKGLKKELKGKSKEELNNIFLLVLNPLLSMNSKFDFTKAIIVRLPDKNRFGVIFVKSLSRKVPVKGDVVNGLVETSEGNYTVLNIDEIWQRNDLMEI